MAVMQKRGAYRYSRHAQVSMEYVILVGFVVVLIIPMLLLFYRYSDDTENSLLTSQANQIARTVVDAAEKVYYLGEPSKTTLKVFFPDNIDNITIGNNELVFIMDTTDGQDHIVVYSPINITGELPLTRGIHYVVVESKGDYVSITSP